MDAHSGDLAPPEPGLNADELKAMNEYRIWKKNSLHLYDRFISTTIPWPSLTVQWFPDVEQRNNYTVQRLLLGTQTSQQGDEYLRIAEATLPQFQDQPDLTKYDNDLGEIGGYQSTDANITIVQKIDHKDEVNRARYMPQNLDILATISSSGTAYVFDRTKHPLQPTGSFKPELTLKFHSMEGYGLAWNPFQEGSLLTAASDSAIAVWDIMQFGSPHRVLGEPKYSFSSHKDTVNQVEWHPFHGAYLFGSVSDDSTCQIHDLRLQGRNTVSTSSYVSKTDDGSSALNSIAFNPSHEYLYATGGADGLIELWDSRKPNNPIHVTPTGHGDAVITIEWNPYEPAVISSASLDRQVMIWDMARIHDKNYGAASELLFVHSGHNSDVNDTSWNPASPWMLASVGNDNSMQIWRPSAAVVDAQNV